MTPLDADVHARAHLRARSRARRRPSLPRRLPVPLPPRQARPHGGFGLPQNSVFDAALQFAHTEGIVPAPESAHAVRGAIDEAIAARDARRGARDPLRPLGSRRVRHEGLRRLPERSSPRGRVRSVRPGRPRGRPARSAAARVASHRSRSGGSRLPILDVFHPSMPSWNSREYAARLGYQGRRARRAGGRVGRRDGGRSRHGRPARATPSGPFRRSARRCLELETSRSPQIGCGCYRPQSDRGERGGRRARRVRTHRTVGWCRTPSTLGPALYERSGYVFAHGPFVQAGAWPGDGGTRMPVASPVRVPGQDALRRISSRRSSGRAGNASVANSATFCISSVYPSVLTCTPSSVRTCVTPSPSR